MDISSVLGTYMDTSVNRATTDVTKNADTDFTQVLTEALEKDLGNESLVIKGNPGTENYEGIEVSANSSLLELISSASKTKDTNTADLALMMLMSMMGGGSGMGGGNGNSGGLGMDMGPMFIALASLIKSFSKEEAAAVREEVMLSEHPVEIKDEIDEKVFNEEIIVPEPGEVTADGNAIIPAEAWRPTTPGIMSAQGSRSADRLRQVIDQFDVENSERYRPYRRGNDTYCNIFLWDVTSALGCEIPHFVDSATGNPRTYPDVKGAVELDANGVQDWLVKSGPLYGWREVTAGEAQEWANSGKPAVTAYKNPGGIGHVQVVCPSKDGAFDPIRGVTVAQAGSNRYSYAHVSSTFGSSKLSQVRYFVHE